MKQKLKVLWMVMVAAAAMTLAGCTSMDSKIVSADDFQKAMEEKGLEVVDITEEGIGFDEAEGKMEKVLIANGTDYQFLYIKMTEASVAEDYFSYISEKFKAEHPNGKIVNGDVNGNKEYSCTSGEDYGRFVKKDTTVVGVMATSKAGTEEAKTILKAMGY